VIKNLLDYSAATVGQRAYVWQLTCWTKWLFGPMSFGRRGFYATKTGEKFLFFDVNVLKFLMYILFYVTNTYVRVWSFLAYVPMYFLCGASTTYIYDRRLASWIHKFFKPNIWLPQG
jgi:hypothetical protein